MSLLFIRHAQTDLAGTFCGHTDTPVNAVGTAQIRALLDELSGLPISHVISSDLQRAATTARAICRQHDAPLTLDPGLRELHFGAWEGMTWSQIEALDAAYARRWADEFPRLPTPEGEHFDLFQQRVLNAARRLLAASGEAQWAVVTHAGVLRVVLEELCHRSPESAWDATSRYCSHFEFAQVQGVTSEGEKLAVKSS